MKEKKMKKILFISIVVLILIILGTLIYNFIKDDIIFSRIENKLANVKIGPNYSYTITNITTDHEGKYKDELSTGEYYVKDDKFYAKLNSYGNEGNTTAIAYKDNTDDIILYDNGKEQIYKINGKTNGKIDMEINKTDLKELSTGILSSIKDEVKDIIEEEKNEKSCYVVTTKNYDKYWIEKDTGIVIYYIYNNNYIFELNYTIGNVSDKDVIKPSTVEYTE